MFLGNLGSRLLRKVLIGMQKGAAEAMQKELQEMRDELMKGTLDPQKIAEFAKAMGIDMSQLPGMMTQQPGFDPYIVLGLDKSATDEEVKTRYRELTFKLHPDKSGTPGTSFLFQMVLAAFEMIKMQRGWQ